MGKLHKRVSFPTQGEGWRLRRRGRAQLLRGSLLLLLPGPEPGGDAGRVRQVGGVDGIHREGRRGGKAGGIPGMKKMVKKHLGQTETEQCHFCRRRRPDQGTVCDVDILVVVIWMTFFILETIEF